MNSQEESIFFLPSKTLQQDFTLNNGRHLPKISFGVNYLQEYENFQNTVDVALRVGYRSFDCSPILMVEEYLGRALEELLPKYELKRGDIMITSKILPRDYGIGSTTEAFWHSCENLKTDYIDVFLMQWPGGHNISPDNEESVILREETWKEIVHLNSEGKIKSPGVCHFSCKHLINILDHCATLPAVVQAEFHPKFQQPDLLAFCEDNDIALQASSFEETIHPLLLNESEVINVAKQLEKTPTQILLK